MNWSNGVSLLDTVALSEIRKMLKGKAAPSFSHWANSVDSRLLFINTIVLMEQRKWALSKRHKKDEIQAVALESWVDSLLVTFAGRILPIDNAIGLKCAELHIPNPRPAFDSLIASTALVHNLILVTDNTKDFTNIDGLRLFNPFTQSNY